MLYMAVALISIKKREIIINSESDQLHTYVNKHLKNIKNTEDLDQWFVKAE